uniref:Uncharacterized protein n=1 Tax=Magallana gigas TaxID=29159 RepID=A0A8W8M3J1_MAGGI|nr:uncharacterized protein LOC105333873 [Crassostrea gigas]
MIYKILILEFALVCILSTSAKSEEEKKRYNYDFEIRPVNRCPMNESDWKAASIRVGCNDTFKYHCLPDRFHSTLIEFCYTSPRSMIEKGNCVELAYNGVLNNVKCENFTEGCPDSPYLSDEIYKYPVCLNLTLRCFTSDKNCLYKK